MSAFLGHIHYWLYNKIRRVIEREQLLYEKTEAVCGSTAEELREQVWQSYGQPLPDVDVSELIDHNNIHGWLQRQITIAETREAAFIKELLAVCGDSGQAVAKEAFREHGLSCGKHAAGEDRYAITTADGIYKALQDYYLNGMPCDQADVVVKNSADKAVWESSECLQAANWQRAGASAAVMQQLYQGWLTGFVEGINPEFTFKQLADIAKGDAVNRQQISR